MKNEKRKKKLSVLGSVVVGPG